VQPCGVILPGADPALFTRERWFALTAGIDGLLPVAPTLEVDPATGRAVHHAIDPAPLQLWIEGEMAGFLHWDKDGALAIRVWATDGARVVPVAEQLAARFGARYQAELT
jgi:hypothetical protein